MSLIYNATFDKNTRKLSFEDKAGNEIYSFIVPSKGLVDDPSKPLMLRAIVNNSSVRLEKRGTLSNTYQTSTDGTNWTDYRLGTQISLNKGESVYFRCSSHPTTQSGTANVYFGMAGKIEAWHNVMSMLRTNDFATYATAMSFAFYRLFQHCNSLTKAPVLPATILSDSCYYDMFGGCSSLTKAPALPATALSHSCYNGIFYSCTSLTEAPVLLATTLAEDCYAYMFSGCSKLKEVRISATKTAKNALNNWLNGVSATGDFYCDPNAKIFPTNSVSGIPANWRRLNINDYPTT